MTPLLLSTRTLSRLDVDPQEGNVQGRGMVLGPAGRRVAALVATCVLVLVTGACGGDGADNAGSDIAPVTDPTTATEPETEDPEATEDPVDPVENDVALELPGLPIGGNSIPASATVQCVDVGWSEPPELPDWVPITVTGAEVQPEDAFALSDEPCDTDAPHCLAEGVQLTASQRCYVAVTWVDPSLDVAGELWFTAGSISCPPDRIDECNAFKAAVEERGPEAIGLEPSSSALTDPTETAETTETTDAGEVEDGG